MPAESDVKPGIHFAPGMMLQQYEIIRLIGTGGMGEVHLARDTRLGRLVAIKFLLEHSGPAAGRFLAEARTTAQCRHDNIVVIYDLGEFNGFPYMVLEFIQGQSLRDTMEGLGRAVVPIILDIILPVVRALDRAHEMGIVHRDLKPENILISDAGQIKVLDFGIAKQISSEYASKNLSPAPPPIDLFKGKPGDITMNDTMPGAEVKPANLSASISVRSSHGSVPRMSAVAVASTIPALVTTDGTRATMPTAPGGGVHRSAISGTMPYMSPEQWLGEGVDARTDIWAVGVILFELLAGVHPLEPLSHEKMMQVRNLDIPMPSARDCGAEPGPLVEIIERCLKKHKEERFGSAQELIEALERVAADRRAVAALSADENPFAGLSAFQKSDAARFFGREHDITAALGKLRSQQLIVIAGASGAGKSSFVRAGILPALEREGRDVESFLIRPGRNPFAALADVLASFNETNDIDKEVDPEALAATLRTQPGLLGAKLRARCRRRGSNHRIVLLVDQLEELFTQGIDAAERAAFCACLEGVADDASSPLRVIATIRADFLDRLAEDRRFWREVTRGLVFLPPMTRDALRDALTKPVEAAQHRFEDTRLVEEMLDGLEGTTTPLPILQFTATKLWDGRDPKQRLLTRAAYEALGGVAGALSTHADAVIAGLSLSEQQIARTMFMALVTPERTRAIVPIADVLTLAPDTAAVDQVLHRLADARLVSMDTSNEQAGKTVEISHESLITRWGKLRQWLDNDEQDAQFVAQLRNAAQQWEKNGEAEGFLWRDRAATEAGQWLERRRAERRDKGSLGLGKREERYLEAVVRLAERARIWRRRIVVSIVASLVVVAVVVSVLAFRAQEQAKRADAEKATAEARRIDADTQKAEAQVQRVEAENNALRARNAMRVAAARVAHDDPTTALALLREIEPGYIPQGWLELAKQARSSTAASTVFSLEDGLFSAAYSPDGRRIVAGGMDDTASVWNVDGSGKPIVFRGHTSDVFCTAWSSDNKHIATASFDKTIRVWNADGSGDPVILKGHEDDIYTVEFSPDGKRLVSASKDKTARVWRADNAGPPIVLRGHGGDVFSATFSPDGTKVASASADTTVRVWNSDGTGQPRIFRKHEVAVIRVAFSPNGKRLASGSDDKTAHVWNIDGGGTPLILRGHNSFLCSVSWSADGNRILTGSYDKTARVWDANTGGEPLMTLAHSAEVSSASYSPDNHHILTSSFDKTVREWPANAPQDTIVLRGHREWITEVTYSPDGKHIVSASADKTIRLWNAETKESILIEGHKDVVRGVAYHPSGNQFASASEDRTVKIWSVDAPTRPLAVLDQPAKVYSVRYSRDGSRMAAALDDGTVRVWKTDDPAKPWVLPGHEAPVRSAVFSPDGTRVVTASMDKTIRIWNADGTGTPTILREHGGPVFIAAFSPDGKRIASASADKTARVWNADGSGTSTVLRGHEHWVNSVAWSPDGAFLATTSQDATVRVWNPDGTGEPLVLRGASLAYNGVDWTPDGKRITAGSDDQTITIWLDIEPIQNADDARLWSATGWCMPSDLRRHLLDFTDARSEADLNHCRQKVQTPRQ